MNAELLAPAGSARSIRAAVAAGADAVYVGGARFGARAYADNPDTEELKEAIDFCHLHGARLYLTVNTLVKDAEIEELYAYLLPLYETGLDAVIVQDIGVLTYIRKAFPGLDIHASTQMTLTASGGAAILEELGATRIVTSRELSLTEIRQIRDHSALEIESFIHGALCYCYSGQCLMSSLIGGRSGNRGRCAQPCRLPWQTEGRKGFLLSPKDICTLEVLPDILEAGVYSLKIEGRMKRPEYTAGVVRIYRKYLDILEKKGREGYRVNLEDIRELMDLYNRGGFSEGYYRVKNGPAMMSMERANHYGTEAAKITSVKGTSVQAKALEPLHKGDVLESDTLSRDVQAGENFRLPVPAAVRGRLRPGTVLHRTRDAALLEELSARYVEAERKEKINGNLMILPDRPVILEVNLGKTACRTEGDIPLPAKSQPLTAERAKAQIEKTGNTPFAFRQLDVTVAEGLFLPMQSLNILRRTALEQLRDALTAPFRRTVPNHLTAVSSEECTRGMRGLPVYAEQDYGEEQILPTAGKEGECKVNGLQASAEDRIWEGHKLLASVEELAQAEALLEVPGLYGIYLDAAALPLPLAENAVSTLMERFHRAGKKCFYTMPRIFRESAAQLYGQAAKAPLELFDGVLIENYEEYSFLRNIGYQGAFFPDHSLYTWNRYAAAFWKERGAVRDTAPVELNSRELKERGCRGSEILVYGRLPMMVSAQCVKKNTRGCDHKKSLLYLQDRMGKRFPVKNQCRFCYNMIYNEAPLSLFSCEKELRELKPWGLRLSFTTETPKEAGEIARAFAGRFVRGERTDFAPEHFTKGHFKRGVE